MHISKQAIETIEAILRQGHDAIVYQSKGGIVVAEQSQRKIKYRTAQRAEQDRTQRVNNAK